jgi:hypothetical protein
LDIAPLSVCGEKFEASKNKLFGTTNNNDYKVNKDYSKN